MSSNGRHPEVPLVPQYVEPAPLGEVWATTGVATQNGQEIVRLEIHSPAGRFVHFLEPNTAIDIGKQITDQGNKSKITRHIIKPEGEPHDRHR